MSIQEVAHDTHVIFVDPLQRDDHHRAVRFQICRTGHIICDWEDIEMPEGFISAQLILSTSVLLVDHRLLGLPH